MLRSIRKPSRWIGVLLACLPVTAGVHAQSVSGSAVQYQTLSIEWEGTSLGETSSTTNPFLDRRLDVEFTNGSTTLLVPGYYAVDNATGVNDIWRVNFTPPEPGTWSYTPKYYNTSNVAVTALDQLGSPTASLINGQDGSVSVAPADINAPGFLAKGTLGYTGGHYLQFANGEYYLKGGADSPENFLGYEGFDNTTKNSVPPALGILHGFNTHIADWRPGDPDWDDDDADSIANDGRGIIGALNYLHNLGDASHTGPAKVNSIYFLPMNIGGDAQDTHPFAATNLNLAGSSSNDNTRYDLSKLDQWDQVFAHAQEKGIMLHFVLNEAENPNKLELDNATLGTERKLFYREIIARFGHHQAIVWNVSEEYNLGTAFGPNDAAEAATVEPFADWIKDLDPYDHPVTVHNARDPNPAGGPNAGTWQYFIGDDSWDLTSLHDNSNFNTLGDIVEAFREATANAGRPIPIMIDEPESVEDISFDEVRKEMLWDILLSGGNVEWYTRSQDQSLDNFRLLEQVYTETYHARKLLTEHTEFWTLEPGDPLLTGEDGFAGDLDPGEVFYREGETYVIYLPDTDGQQTGSLDLSSEAENFLLQWYDPTSGEFVGDSTVLQGGSIVDLPDTPGLNASGDNDWAALLTLNATLGPDQLQAVLDNWGSFVTQGDTLQGDFNGDGLIGAADLDIVLGRWGRSEPIPATVPEPASAALLLLSLIVIGRRAHQRTRR